MLVRELEEWMEQQGFEQLDELRGRMSQASVQNPSDYERLNYIRVLQSYDGADGVWR
jgi:dihydroorotate dehydrogenase (fumarate)